MTQIFPWLGQPAVQALTRAFPEGTLRFIGGCVRDSVMGRQVNDIDAATTLLPDETVATLREAGFRAIPTGISHGTVTALVQDTPFEITTLRRDTSCDGRHAMVAFTEDWEEDATRRDFTVNALSLTPEGELHDYTGGKTDIEQKRLRFIGIAEARVQEDYLRILRYYRFGAQLGWDLNDQTARAACTAHADKLLSLSGERLWQELEKILRHSPLALEAMRQDGVLAQLLPEATTLKPAAHTPDALARLGAMLPPGTPLEPLKSRFRWSRRETEDMRFLLSNFSMNSEAERKALLRQHGARLYTLAAWVACARAGTDDFGAWAQLPEQWVPPVFPLSGKELMAHGIPAGPKLGATLRRLENEWEKSGYALKPQELLSRI